MHTIGTDFIITDIQIIFIDELHSIYLPVTQYFKHHLQPYSKQLLNKWFIMHLYSENKLLTNV